MKSTKYLHQAHAALENAVSGFRAINKDTEAVVSELATLERQYMESVLASDKPVVKEDAQVFVHLVSKHGEAFTSER